MHINSIREMFACSCVRCALSLDATAAWRKNAWFARRKMQIVCAQPGSKKEQEKLKLCGRHPTGMRNIFFQYSLPGDIFPATHNTSRYNEHPASKKNSTFHRQNTRQRWVQPTHTFSPCKNMNEFSIDMQIARTHRIHLSRMLNISSEIAIILHKTLNYHPMACRYRVW